MKLVTRYWLLVARKISRGGLGLGSHQPRATSHQRGFTLLLAALVASIVLAVGSAIFSIAQKQITLSSIGKESQYAFYAADAGSECAQLWDKRTAAFDTTDYTTSLFGTTTPTGYSSPTCDGAPITVSGYPGTNPPFSASTCTPVGQCYVENFQYDLCSIPRVSGNPNCPAVAKAYCVKVTVTKTDMVDGNGKDTGVYNTDVIADGYNVSCNGPINISNSPRALERSIKQHW